MIEQPLYPRVRGAVFQIAEGPHKDLWDYEIEVLIGPTNVVNPIIMGHSEAAGYFKTEKEALARLKVMCEEVAQFVGKQMHGKAATHFIDMKTNQIYPQESKGD